MRRSGSQSTSPNSASTIASPLRPTMRSLVVTLLLTEVADRALHGDRLEGGVDLPLELHGAAPDHVLVPPDPARRQERVAPLLQIGQDDGVVDVAEAVEVPPAHLHRVAASSSPVTHLEAEGAAQRLGGADELERVVAASGE